MNAAIGIDPSNPKRTVAVVILTDRHARLLFVRTKRFPHCWQPVGGGMDPGDKSIKETAVREVKEETGLNLESSQLREVFRTSYDFGQGKVYFFLARAPIGLELRVDENEIDEWRWLSLEEAKELPMYPATEKCVRFLARRPELLRQDPR